MAQLLMECEEEDLEPWQKRLKEVEEDDDDEPIFVREITVSKQIPDHTPETHPSSFSQVENGTPTRGSTGSFHPSNNHYKTISAGNSVTQSVSTINLPISRPVTSSAIVQPLPRSIGSPEPIKRPLTGCLSTPLTPRPRAAILQPVSRPVTVPSNVQPVCRNITFPVTSQPAHRPIATITAQPVILNQGYIVNSPQVTSSSTSNVMYALRPNTTIAQYQSVHPLTTAGNATQLVRPIQPLNQSHLVSTPARTVNTYMHKPPAQMPTATRSLSFVAVPQQSFQLNSQKTLQGIQPQYSEATIGCNDSTLKEKRPAPAEVSSISPKKTKIRETEGETQLVALTNRPPTLSQPSPVKGNAATSSGTILKNGPRVSRACPKCNLHFNLSEPMRKHMKFCCPDKVDHFFSGLVSTELPGTVEETDRKLIMLVSDFYYGKYTGDPHLAQQEQKTHTTFKCFSCQKVLKNNIRFMNHMKHHLELEKQSTESWENHTTCHHCYRQFPTPFQLQCHIESSHTLYESTTICKICELSFESEQILLQHMKDNHKPGEMPYVCQVCNYRSSTFIDVDTHFRSAHENTKSLLCPFCLKVIKCGTPYMQHYMKHQNKGVYRCAKCRLQFLSCKEKMDHKTQHHRTFRKPKQLEGLPPGTKVTIRASVGSIINAVPSPTTTTCTNHTSIPLQIASKNKITNSKIAHNPFIKLSVQNAKLKPPPPKKNPVSANNPKRIKIINTSLQNLRSESGHYKCIECLLEVKDFEGHFHAYVHCSKCKFSTSCNKAYMNHILSFHGRNSVKRYKAFKKTPKAKRRITLVCLNCDFLTDVSGLDEMAKHLSESHSHSCQVIQENVSIISSTLEGDIAKSRSESSVADMQKKALDAKESIETKQSKKENDAPVKINTEYVGKDKHGKIQISILPCNRLITPIEPEKDSDKTTQHGCIANLFIGEPESDREEKNLSSSVTKHISEEDPSESRHILNNKSLSDLSEDDKVSSEHVILNDGKERKDFDREETSFVQFFRRKDEPESIYSDVHERSSIHLEPLTPSEVLEHEATEILSKGSVATCPPKGASCEETDATRKINMITLDVVKMKTVSEAN